MGASIPLNQVARLRQRCAKINELYKKDRKNYKYCRAIFLHVDSRSKSHQTDVFFYHSKNRPDSKRLAKAMKKTFESEYDRHQPNRGFTGTVSARNLYVLANTSPASVFVELGNIQNTFDQRRFVISSNRQALSKWMKRNRHNQLWLFLFLFVYHHDCNNRCYQRHADGIDWCEAFIEYQETDSYGYQSLYLFVPS